MFGTLGDPGSISSREALSTIRGTFRFWPPEGTVDHTPDLYALGKTMYPLLAGAHVELPDRIDEVTAPVGVDASSQVWGIIERACAVDPSRRYRSAAEMRRDVERLRSHGGGRWQLRLRSWFPTATAVLVSLVVVSAGLLWLRQPVGLEPQQPPTASSTDPRPDGTAALGLPSTSAPLQGMADPGRVLQGHVTVRAWNRGDPDRRGRAVDEPGMLPLRNGDQIRVEATLTRPAYVYLVWIGTEGTAQPIYPWKPGDWASFPTHERPVQRLALPEGEDQGWPVTGPAGMETLVLLASTKPARDPGSLRERFRGLPTQPLSDKRPLLVRLERDAFVASAERGLDFAPGQIDDPVLRGQRLLAERFAKDFELVRVVSFANKAGSPGPQR